MGPAVWKVGRCQIAAPAKVIWLVMLGVHVPSACLLEKELLATSFASVWPSAARSLDREPKEQWTSGQPMCAQLEVWLRCIPFPLSPYHEGRAKPSLLWRTFACIQRDSFGARLLACLATGRIPWMAMPHDKVRFAKWRIV